jgi:hypothetical protein
MKAVATIMEETREVSQILARVMDADTSETEEVAESDEPIEAVEPKPRESTAAVPIILPDSQAATGSKKAPTEQHDRFQGLAARFQPFLEAALKQDRWAMGEITELARQHHLMLAGAIEAINDWSCDRHGDWLIEEGDPVTIHLELLEKV